MANLTTKVDDTKPITVTLHCINNKAAFKWDQGDLVTFQEMLRSCSSLCRILGDYEIDSIDAVSIKYDGQ